MKKRKVKPCLWHTWTGDYNFPVCKVCGATVYNGDIVVNVKQKAKSKHKSVPYFHVSFDDGYEQNKYKKS